MIGRNATEGTILGGTCINVGCVPSKRLLTVSTFFRELGEKRFRGVDYRVNGIDYEEIFQEKRRLVEKLRNEKYGTVLESLENVTYINSFGSFIDENTIKAGKVEIAAKNTLVATGARAMVPELEDLSKVDYLTSEDALSLRKLPDSILIIGGRAIGLEFAQMFSDFGVKVTLLQRSSRIIPNWEPEISEYLKSYLEKGGVKIVTNAELVGIDKNRGRKTLKAKIGERAFYYEADEVLFATGRVANTEKLNATAAGVRLDGKKFVIVDKTLRTSSKVIYAAGDVTGQPMLETLAAKEGSVATSNIFQHAKKRINLNEIPSAIFTYPEAAMVGRTEEQIVKDGIQCACSPLNLDLVPKAKIVGDYRGVVKIVIDHKTKKILGVHMLASHAADMIHEGVLAVKFGLTIDDIIDTVHVFPTLSESFKLAAQSFYEDVSRLSCCTA